MSEINSENILQKLEEAYEEIMKRAKETPNHAWTTCYNCEQEFLKTNKVTGCCAWVYEAAGLLK